MDAPSPDGACACSTQAARASASVQHPRITPPGQFYGHWRGVSSRSSSTNRSSSQASFHIHHITTNLLTLPAPHALQFPIVWSSIGLLRTIACVLVWCVHTSMPSSYKTLCSALQN